jgi:PTH1 family peptidyl-tRNA hydrolase
MLLVGLGNPGSEYARHRHNVGFMAIDAISEAHGFGPWRRRFHALVAEGKLGPRKAVALKPATFMNRSGEAVGEAQRFFKIALDDIVVFHDELDLAPGKVRVKQGGGAAGHNGLRSLDAHIGPGYRRVRIGVGHPGDKDLVESWVLSNFAKSDRDWLKNLLHAMAEACPLLGPRDDAGFMTKVALLSKLPPATTERPA